VGNVIRSEHRWAKKELPLQERYNIAEALYMRLDRRLSEALIRGDMAGIAVVRAEAMEAHDNYIILWRELEESGEEV